jgi:putative sterol carrier protein
MEGASVEQQILVPTGPIQGQAPGLVGVKGKLRVVVGDATLGVLAIDGSAVVFTPGDGAAETAVVFDDRQDIVRLLCGELNPVVALLQDRMRVEGDPLFAAQVILGLRAGSSFKGERLVQEG